MKRSARFLLAGITICGALLTGCASTPRWPAITPEPAAQPMPGRWVWAELFTADAAAAKRFYGDVFGWQFESLGVGRHGYSLVRADGQPIAGILQKEPKAEATTAGRWLGLLSVADVDRAAELASAAGGKVLLAPRDLAGRGRVAILADPEGARFGVLRAEGGDPPDVFPAYDTWGWRELWARDAGAMAAFYRPLADYKVAPQPKADGIVEYHLVAAGYPRAGILQVDAADLPSAWLPYIRVRDLHETLGRVEQAGGELLVAPDPGIRQGRVAVIRDPLGAALGIAEWDEAEGQDRQ